MRKNFTEQEEKTLYGTGFSLFAVGFGALMLADFFSNSLLGAVLLWFLFAFIAGSLRQLWLKNKLKQRS